MQVLLNTDPHTDGRHEMATHLEQTVKEALHRFDTHLTRVEAHLIDAGSHARNSPHDIQCTLEARLTGLDPVVVKDHAGNAHQAINGAVGKLKRAISTVLEKHESTRGARPLGELAAGQDDASTPAESGDLPV